MTKIAEGKYGYFDSDRREYVITRPDTPRPWFNYMMNDTFVSMISNTGGGVAYDTDPRVYRLLRYRYQNLPCDRPGRYIYVRDHDTGKYWAGTWAPVHMPVEKCSYTCRVGTNYQVITMTYNGIRTEITYFVPLKGKQEIWDLTVTNVSKRTRKLSTYSYAEFAFWGAMRDLMNIDNTPNMSLQEYHEDLAAIVHHSWNDIGTELHDMNFVQHYGFHTSFPACTAHNGDRDLFIGRYRDEKNPVVVETGKSTNYCKDSGYPVGSLEHRFTLKPGASKRIVYRTGMTPEKKDWKREARRFDTCAKVDRAFKALLKDWKARLDCFQVTTPDCDFNTAVNGFVQYQSAMTMRLSRSISPYEWGIRRSIGFRDSSQDLRGLLHAFPEVARTMLEYIVSAIHEDGQACHDFNPVTNSWGEPGFYDDHNWPALTVNAYIKETGDLAFLQKRFPYAQSRRKGTVLEHLVHAQDFAWKKRGAHGLMQTGAADWNDSLNPGDRETESMFTSALYCASTLALIELAEQLGETRLATKWKTRYSTIKKKMNTSGWDGRWYKRMIKTNGLVLGSKKTHGYARIFLEPQPWAVIAGICGGKRAEAMLDEVEKRLGSKYGHKIMDIPFTKFEMEEIGSATVVAPGNKENGGMFSHASAWMITAEALLGRGNKAYEYFMRKAGTTKNGYTDQLEVEPYVSCQFITQPPFHIVGRGRNQWLTGSAAWIAQGAMQGIIGCRADFDGLIIDPSIPSKWKGFELTRVFRGTTYEITVRNPKRVQHGVKELVVDGKKMRGNRIPHDGSKKRVKVTVTMG
jgi:cellobiose phosphorylase